MTPEAFDAIFDEGWRQAFRLETQRVCKIPAEAQRVRAFSEGTARPVRSVATDPWMARIAVTSAVTLERPKRWQHVMVLDKVLTEYQQYRLVGLVESQAAGEDVRVLLRDGEERDFWLFDDTVAVFLSYDSEGRFTSARRTSDTAEVIACVAARDRALRRAVPLNEYLARHREALRAA